MLKYLRFSFSNGYTFSQCDLPLNDQGIVLVLGKNLKTGLSNGAGKSSPWKCLKSIQYETKSAGQLVNRHNPDGGYFGELEFETDNHYLVTEAYRHPKHGNGITISKNGLEIQQKHIKRARKQLQGIVGLTEVEYDNCVYLTDKQSSLLLNGKPAERDDYLSNLFNLTLYEQLEELVKEDLDEINNFLERKQKVSFQLEDVEKKLSSIEKPSKEDLQDFNKKIKEKTEEHLKLQAKHKRWVEIRTGFKQRLDIEKQIEEIGEPSVEITEDDIERLEKKVSDTEKALLIRRQRDKIKEELKSLPKVGLSTDDIEKKLSRCEKSLLERKKALDSFEERKEIESKVKTLRDKIGNKDVDSLADTSKIVTKCELQIEILSKRYQNLANIDSNECPTCGSNIENKESVLDSLKIELKTTKHKHKKYSSRLDQLEKLRGITDRIKQYKNRLSELPDIDKSANLVKENLKYERLVGNLRKQIRVVDLRSRLEKQLEELPSGRPENLDELKNLLNTARKNLDKTNSIKKLTRLLKDLPKDGPKSHHIEALEKKITSISRQISVLQLKDQKLLRDWEEWNELSNLYESLKEKDLILRKKRKESIVLGGLKSAFGRNGLRVDTLRSILSAIMDSLPRYINLLFAGENLKVKIAEDTFDFDVYCSKVQIPKQNMSRGERAKLVLALFLATRHVLPNRKRANILVVDEVLDGIDPKGGFSSVFDSFDYLREKENISSIFVISHTFPHEKKLLDRFDGVWTTIKDRKNISTIEFTHS